jgi:putative ABC transport system permease protein
MIRSLLQLSLRNLFRKNRLFTFINIGGLAIGLACLLLISLFIYDEYSFDRFHKSADRIHRIVVDFSEEGNMVNWARSSAPIAQYLAGAYPEIEQVVRLRKNPGTDLLSHEDIKFYEERIFFADSTLFDVFDFKLKAGDPTTALKDKNSIVLTGELARKFFSDADPLGKSLRLNNTIDLKVTGVLHEIPSNSHFVADAFITFSSLENLMSPKRLAHWGWFDHYTYLLLAENSTPEELEAKFPAFLKANAPEWVPEKERLSLQPLTSIHLHSDRKDEITPNSRETYSYILGTIAVFILLMAYANFANLSTATLVSRYKEISIQKVLGARALHLTTYFWIESIAVSLISLLFAFVLALVALPYFNLYTGKNILCSSASWLVVPSVSLVVVIGVISGLIPAFQINRLGILKLARQASSISTKSTLRTALTTFQFGISILLISSTWIVTTQFSFLKSSRFGFNSERVIAIPIKDRSQNDKHTVYTNKISQLPGVEKASFSSSMPGCNNAYTYTYSFAGSDAGEQTMAVFLVDENFFDLYRMELKEGRFPDLMSKDTLTEVVLNEAAVAQLRLTNPIGQLVTGQVKGRVVGVIKDFNFESLHSPIRPVILYSYHSNFRFVSVELKNRDQSNLKELEAVWQEFYPGYPLEYFYIDDKIQQLYGTEFQLSKAYTAFSSIAIVIAGIGLIGLTTYLMTRKLKEISIRKIFGSSTLELVMWIYSGYSRIVVFSIVIAWTLGYYWMNKWLNGFAHKAQLGFVHFLYPALIMIFILLLTTMIQTLKASRTNPVDNLRDE